MKASELISKLQELIEKHGDLPVSTEDGYDPSEETEVEDVGFKDSGRTCYSHEDENPKLRFYIQ